MDILSQYTLIQWCMILTSGFIIGLSKAGVKGIDMLTVTLMAIVFGGKSSTGVVLPMLCVADIAAVIYYHRHAQWSHVKKLVPWMIVGILLGVWLGKDMNEAVFRKVMAVIILITIIIVLWMEYRRSKEVPHHPAFAAGTGLAAGFTTMIGNLAGAFNNLYFLAMRVNRHNFIGTAAWIFLFMNLFKVPFQVIYWNNINLQSLSVNLLMLPLLALGFFTGIKIVKRIHDDNYRKLIIAMTLIGAIVMLFRR